MVYMAKCFRWGFFQSAIGHAHLILLSTQGGTMADLADQLANSDEQPNPLAELTIEALIKHGVQIRDELREEKRKFDKFEASAKDMLARISMALKAKGDELHVNSFATSEGTAYRNLKESYRVGNWDEFLPWLKETGNFQCLEKRAAKLATKEIHQSTGQVPPGIQYVAEEEFLIRRPNEKRGSKDE
jgi:hypothetical protein